MSMPWSSGGGLVYAGGHFVTAGGVTANGIAAWNGSNWSSLGSGTDGWVYALAVIGSDPYAGGSFSTAGGVSANNIAKWNGVNAAFTLSPEGVIFGGTGATLRVEFSEDDVAAHGADPADFRAFRPVYPPDYPANKEATIVPVPNSSAPLPVRIENGKQIYAIEVTISGISSTYGAIPKSLAAETGVEAWERYE